MNGFRGKDSSKYGHSLSSREIPKSDYDIFRHYIFYQTSWPLFRCQHDQTTPYLPPEFAGLHQNEALWLKRIDYQRRIDEEKSARKLNGKKTKSAAVHAVSIPVESIRHRKCSSSKTVSDYERTGTACSVHLSNPELFTCSAFRYITPYGYLYELRKCRDQFFEKKGVSVWLWEDEYQKWRQKKIEFDQSFNSRHRFKMPRTNKTTVKISSKQRPHADVYAKFFEKNLSKQKRKQTVTIVQKIARGWLTRVLMKRLARKAQIHHKQTLSGMMQEYKNLIGRLRERCELSANDYKLNLSNVEDYMNRKLTYDMAFNKVANEENQISLQNLKSFFWNCRLYPTNKEIQMALKKVSQTSRNRHDLMILLENSSRISEKSFQESQELLKMLVSAIDLKRFRNRIGIVTYTGSVDVISALGQIRNSKQLIQIIQEMKARTGHSYINQAFRLLQTKMQEFPRPWCQQICLVVTGGRGLNREDVREEAMKIRQKGANIFVIGVSDQVKTEESLQLTNSRDQDFRLNTYDSVEDLMNDLFHRMFPLRTTPESEFTPTELFRKCDVFEVLWTIYPPKGVGLTGVKKSRWIRPVIDGEEAWSLLDDEILSKTDLKSCLRLVVKSTLEREGFIAIPSNDLAGVTKVTDLETALQQMEDYIQERKKESRQKDRLLQNNLH